jgi:hypothetical protein
MSTFSPAQTIIAAMITPALLILASASLIATALVRLARVVDRIRKLAEARDATPISPAELDRHERRARLALLAVAFFFSAVAVVVAAGVSIALDGASGGHLTWLPLGLTFLGMALIVAGAAAMLAESGYSAAQIRAEISALR